MKVSEFKKAIDNLSSYYGKYFKVVEDDSDYCIESDTKVLAIINKSEKCLISTNYWDFLELEEGLRQSLFDIICKFASTPIPEREDEKIYIVPLPHLTTSDGEQLYLTHRNGHFFTCWRKKRIKTNVERRAFEIYS